STIGADTRIPLLKALSSEVPEQRCPRLWRQRVRMDGEKVIAQGALLLVVAPAELRREPRDGDSTFFGRRGLDGDHAVALAPRLAFSGFGGLGPNDDRPWCLLHGDVPWEPTIHRRAAAFHDSV